MPAVTRGSGGEAAESGRGSGFAFKVKTSDTLLYRVSPVYGFVEPHEDHKVAFTL